jgi:transcriptional regulator with XRE-family HTH domain
MPRTEQPQPALGKAVRQLREKRGLKQESLAYEAGLTIGTVSQLERGLTNPTWATVKLIASRLGVSIGELGQLAEALEKTS